MRLAVPVILLASLLSVAAAQDTSDTMAETQVHVVPRPAFGPRLPITAVTMAPSIAVNVNVVVVPVLVTDVHDRPVTGLTKQNFSIYQDKVQENIRSFSVENEPISVGIIYDLSGSMKGESQTEEMALASFLGQAKPQDEFFLVGFSGGPKLLSGFTRNTADLQNRVALLQPSGSTALLDAIDMGMAEMRSHAHFRRRALLVISDGGDNHSRYMEDQIRELIQEADVQIYALGVADPAPTQPEVLAGPNLLNEMATQTGGRYFEVDAFDLPQTAAQIGSELHDQYVLTYRPLAPPKPGTWHSIRVKLMPPSGRHFLQVYSKHGYYAPAD